MKWLDTWLARRLTLAVVRRSATGSRSLQVVMYAGAAALLVAAIVYRVAVGPLGPIASGFIWYPILVLGAAAWGAAFALLWREVYHLRRALEAQGGGSVESGSAVDDGSPDA